MANKQVIWILSVGLAFAFLYASISAFFQPDAWIGFVPQWFQNILFYLGISANTYLFAHAIFDGILGIWLLTGWKIKIVAALGALNLFSIIIGYGIDLITFRDIGLLAIALALLFEKSSHT